MLELLLNVNEEMRLTKTKFWRAMNVNPICDPDHVTLNAALQLTGEDKLQSWWKKPGFIKWFCQGDEFETKLSAARFQAIDTLMDIMANVDSPASARVAAAKQVMDHSKQVEKDDSSLDKALEKIAGINNPEDLKKYIEK
jgi:hypothetical protein